MADFDIERPTIETQPVQPTYNVNPPQFTIELNGSTPGQRGEKGDPGQDGINGTNGTDGIDGVGIASIEQTTTSTVSGGTNIITATLTNGESSTFEIMNGEAGAGGLQTLDDTISSADLFALDTGYYIVPINCYISDASTTIEHGGLLYIKHMIDDGFDIATYYILEDWTTYNLDYSYDPDYPNIEDFDGKTRFWFGEVCDDLGDFRLSGPYDVILSKDVVNNLTTNSNTKPLSAAQGKVLKEMISNFDLTPWFSSYQTVSDGNYHGTITDGKYNVANEAYILDDNLVDAYINTEAIMHHDSSNNWGRLDDVLDAKANTSDIPTNTSDLNNDSGFITSETDPVFSASAAAGISSSDISNWNGKSDFSGSYNDLTDQPTIPDELSDLSDDSTHRLVTDTEKSTWSGKQDALVSGTNIKTINNNSILGSGNLTISGGSSTDVQINGTSITVGGEANILTETAYNSSTNKIATMSDVPDTSSFIDKDVNNLTNYSLTTTLQANKSLTKGVEYIVGTQASATSSWKGTSTDTGCSSGALYTGKVIIYHLPVAGSSSAATLNLTLPDGTTTGAKNVYRLASTTTTTNFAAGCDILMVYDGTNWKVNAYVDTSGSNTIGYQLRTNSALWKNKTGYKMNRYTLLFEVDGGLSGAATTIATGTSKTTINFKYIPGGVIKYYSTSGDIANDATFTANGLWDQYTCNLGYTFNTGSTLTGGKPVYMRCTVNADGTLSPDYSGTPSHPIVQDLPTTADSKVYVYLGQAYNTTNIELYMNHPIYEYKNGKIRQYIAESSGGGGTITDVQVNGTSVVAGGVANVVTETAYDASTNKIATMSDLPTVPTVNDATLTIQKNSTSLGTFTANASTNQTINITVPTKVSDITNDSGFVTSTNVGDTIKTTGYNSTTDANLGAIDIINVIKRYSGSNAAYLNTDSVLYKDSNNNNNVLSDVIDDLKQGTMEELTSPVSLKDLSSGVYKVPANCILMAETGGQSVKTTTYGGILIIAQQTDAASFIYIDNEQTVTPDYNEGVSYTTKAMIGYGFVYDTGPGNNNEYDYQYNEVNLYDLNNVLTSNSIVDNLTTNDSSKVLSAAQGKALKDTINGLSIPTVNDSTITIQKNGTTVDSFTTNASSGKSINISVPTNTSDLNNDSGFVTTNNDIQVNGISIVVSNVANLLTETAYNSSTNKIATMSDVPDVSNFIDKDVNNLTYYTTTSSLDDIFGAGTPWVSNGTYKKGQVVRDARKYYRNKTGTNTATHPISDTTNWETITLIDLSAPDVLYYDTSGSDSSITLSKDVSNYSYLEIFYGWGANTFGTESTKVDLSLGGDVVLTTTVLNNNNIYTAASEWTPTGTNLNLTKGEYWRWATSGNPTRQQTNNVRIFKVLGYK